MNNNTKKITVIGMLTALAYIAVFCIRIPAVSFLKYEPKDVVIAIGGFICGPVASLIMAAAVSLIEMVTITDTGYIGLIMNFLSSAAFAVPAALIYSRRRTFGAAVLGLLCGCLSMTAVMLLWNYLITPLYMKVDRATVAKMLPTVFLPFNLVKSILNCALAVLLYKPLVRVLRAIKLTPEGVSGGRPDKKNTVLGVVVSVLVIISAVLVFLIWNDVI